jgi:hypothetical protein
MTCWLLLDPFLWFTNDENDSTNRFLNEEDIDELHMLAKRVVLHSSEEPTILVVT